MKKSEIKLKRLKTNAVIENGIQTELKKSEIKLQTCKKDSQTRLKKCEVILKKSDITEHDIFPRVENKHDKTTSILKNNCNSSEIKTKTSEIKLKTLKKNTKRLIWAKQVRFKVDALSYDNANIVETFCAFT